MCLCVLACVCYISVHIPISTGNSITMLSLPPLSGVLPLPCRCGARLLTCFWANFCVLGLKVLICVFVHILLFLVYLLKPFVIFFRNVGRGLFILFVISLIVRSFFTCYLSSLGKSPGLLKYLPFIKVQLNFK